jgi:hypothetical protein
MSKGFKVLLFAVSALLVGAVIFWLLWKPENEEPDTTGKYKHPIHIE